MSERFYELAVLFQPELTSENVKEESKKIEELLTKNQAKLLKRDEWGKKKLVYPIKKKKDAWYIIYYFTALPEIPAKLNSPLFLNPNVLRFFIVLSNHNLSQFTQKFDVSEQAPENVTEEIEDKTDQTIDKVLEKTPGEVKDKGVHTIENEVTEGD